MWVYKQSELQHNTIVDLQTHGEPQPSNVNDVGVQDFALGIQTEFQQDIMKEYENCVICMDSTHRTKHTQHLSLIHI